MMRRFLKLFKVKIFPEASVHMKDAILKGVLFLQMHFQRQGELVGGISVL